MVAVDGVDAVPRPDAAQHRGDLLRLLHGLPGVIKNVARDDDHIGILLVYARDHAFHLRKAHVVAEVEIGEQHDLHALHAAGGLVYGKKIKLILNDEETIISLKRAKDLSGKFKMLTFPMKIKSVALCMLFGRIISLVRKFCPSLFIKIKEKEVHGK